MNIGQDLLRPVTPWKNWTPVDTCIKVSRTSSYHMRAIEILNVMDKPMTKAEIVTAMVWPLGTTEKRLEYLLNIGLVKRKKMRIAGKNSQFVYEVVK